MNVDGIVWGEPEQVILHGVMHGIVHTTVIVHVSDGLSAVLMFV